MAGGAPLTLSNAQSRSELKHDAAFSKSHSDSTLACAASAPHAAHASLIHSCPFATSIARTRISFSQVGQIQTGGGGDGSGWRGRGMIAAVPADGDGVRVCRIHNRRQSFISTRKWNLLRQPGLCLFGSSSSCSCLGRGRGNGNDTCLLERMGDSQRDVLAPGRRDDLYADRQWLERHRNRYHR
jgi:hypothetical protein